MIEPLIDALRIYVRHEEVRAPAAVGYAKFAGRPGVCLGTTGPGTVHLLNGMRDARMDQAPVLAITGLTRHDLIGTYNVQGAESTSVDKNHLRRSTSVRLAVVKNISLRINTNFGSC